jgi:hypothetical protein
MAYNFDMKVPASGAVMGICRRNIQKVQIVGNGKVREHMSDFYLLRKRGFGTEEK